ncbi:MAG: radical SAM protein, partial [Planctomycetota bacterium]
MLTEIHFLLTYMCNLECEHCFLFCSPTSKGTFTLNQIRKVYDELTKIGTIKRVYFEGGEPFLFYPIMREALKIAHEMGLETGIITNSYWA